MVYKKILSALLSLCLILHPLPLYADDVASSSATVEQSTPSSETSTEGQTSHQDPLPTISGSKAAGNPPIASDSATTDVINIGTNTEVTSTTTTTNDTTVTNTNDAQVTQTIDATADTGNNTAENTVLSETKTGDATTSATVVNEVNTNIVGEDIHKDVVVLNNDHAGEIDLSDKPLCADRSPAAWTGFTLLNAGDDSNFTQNYIDSIYTAIYNYNTAKVVNEITLAANTGGNSSSGIMNLTSTGDANVLLNVYNLVNTNLIGNCGYFGSVTVFGDQTGDIILPNELNYLVGGEPIELSEEDVIFVNSGDTSSLNSSLNQSNSTDIINNNTTSISNDITVSSNTGGNQSTGLAGSVQTGAANTTVNTLDRANTNLVGDRWVLVIVNTTGEWNGGVENWTGNTSSTGGSTMMWVRLPESYGKQQQSGAVVNSGDNTDVNLNTETESTTVVENNNKAVVENKINLAANTGNNSADGIYNEIKTGDANVTVNETTTANTNIIGNNWFFSLINIFGNFTGNLVFARPDLEIKKIADKSEAAEGENIDYTIQYRNKGKAQALNVVLSDIIPPGTEVIAYSVGGTLQNEMITWNLGTLAKNAAGTVNVVVRSTAPRNEIVNTASITTSSNEPNKANNLSSAVTRLSATGSSNPSVVTQSTNSVSVTPTPTVISPTVLGVEVTQSVENQGAAQYMNGNLQGVQDEVSTDSGDILSFGAFDRADVSKASFCSRNSEICVMLGTGLFLPAVVYIGWKRRAFILSRVKSMNIFG